MRKCILVLLILSTVAAARDPVDAQRAALRKKLTRLAKARKSSAAAQPLPALPNTPGTAKSASRYPQPAPEVKKPSAEVMAQQRAAGPVMPVDKQRQPAVASQVNRTGPAAVGSTDVAPTQEKINSATTEQLQGGNREEEISLGEIARRYRALKRQQRATSR